MILLDLVALTAAGAAAYFGRQWLLSSSWGLSEDVGNSAVVMGAGCVLAIAMFGGYDVRRLSSGPEMFRNVLHGSAAAASLIGAVNYLLKFDLSRGYFLIFFILGPCLLLLLRLLERRMLNLARSRGRLRRRVIAVGLPAYVDGVARTFARERWLGYDIVGSITPTGSDGTSTLGIPVLGAENDLLDVVDRERPSVLLFATGSTASTEEFRRVAWMLEEKEVRVIVVPALAEIAASRVRMRPIAGLPLVHVDLPRARQALKWTKRTFDVIASTALLLILSPLLLGIALVVKAADGGPIIFRQDRVGRDGEKFEFLKFRSMVPDAEAVLKALYEQSKQDRGNSVMFKMRDDPRITRPGKVMRRFSLDELPQLWNVLRGDMSLVGPRPALPREVDGYSEDAHRRYSVRPGITGLWQVSGRSDLSWEDTVRLDLYYVDNWSFAQDMIILFRTVRAVFSSSGAY
ncbi:sugar transferase [Brachybacterium massiliense]|uniref:sugar transferase n=1 Tax=Brachybacterium massiliense TaxID=1755098 RepID=UPI000B3BC12A|nr:sugar transferase [Brachybacterium massiliense]